MTSSPTSRSALALLLVTFLVPATASAQASGITNGQIFEAIGVRDGGTVCEMGAGDGELTLAAARLVGPAGRVYTSELGDDRVKALREKLAGSHLSQITVVAGDASGRTFLTRPATRCSCAASTTTSRTRRR